MSIFNNNIVNDISAAEKVRYWITDEVTDYFDELHSAHLYSEDYLNTVYDAYDITDSIHRSLASRWVESMQHGYLKELGVTSTITDVKKKRGQNQFCVIVRFSFVDEPMLSLNPSYDAVEIKNLAI